jgi:hypothetical protein
VDADRRSQLAEAARPHVRAAQEAVVASWEQLIPASTEWRPELRRRAVSATDAAVAALVAVIEQGDLDHRDWHALRQAVLPHGYLVASELLRAVHLVGLEGLATKLTAACRLTHAERWQMQQEVSALWETLLMEQAEASTESLDSLLGELADSAPDFK